MEALDVIRSLIDAIQSRAWYPIVALSFTLIVGLLRRVNPDTWERLPKWAKPLPTVVLGVLTAFVTAFESSLPWTEALGVALYTFVVSTTMALGMVDGYLRLTGSKDRPQDQNQ
jgi:hypothetical protein